ncbi:Crp/Fnr family transcriptional regulator [Hymenobacter cheonanensis]|uniref:Crp/Fnr family transcriptional regulator n=1 Tax=Hymenobacter sp. CA2-7 TaxID=3063993 RepID=UPI00271420A5|nr:Crp/Fnr family transcriptional regulator [Hymenobacter sp. CA2-7]MDO7886139.1 Crp/Fnr family transcriptional regulator [Hymenobacter sp. CA2-7]
MTQEKLVLFLQRTAHLTAGQALAIAAEFEPVRLRKHDFLLQAGTVSDDYLFLEAGLLRAFAYDPAGHDVTTGFYAPGEVVFEVASFFQRTPSLEYMQALADCTGWRLTFAQLNALFHARPEFREFGRAVLVRGFAALKTRMLATITEPAAARYEHLLRASPEVGQHAPLKHIASYLGITDTSLSRLRKALVQK